MDDFSLAPTVFSTATVETVKLFISTWIKPKLDSLQEFLKKENVLLDYRTEEAFEEYFKRSHNRIEFINTIVFQNQQKKIGDLYIPLTLVSSRDNKLFKIKSYPGQLISEFKRLLITDSAGMGKSTVLKWIFLAGINENKAIPIFIELRKLKLGNTIVDEIKNQLSSIDSRIDEVLIFSLIKRGDFVFIFDGYDEIPTSEKGFVTTNLQDFCSKAENNHFIISSRADSSLSCFGDFQHFSIQPLKVEESFALIKKYDNNGHISKDLISNLKGKALENIKEFLTNPMLVSLLYKAYSYKPTLPFKKPIFYRQVYDALFDNHDLTKGGAFIREKHSGLDIEDFHRVLRYLGYYSMRGNKIEYSKDEIIQLITLSKDACFGLNFKESDFLADLTTTVPLFNIDGVLYRWSHKSIQDYFSAQFICIDSKENQTKIMLAMYKSPDAFRYRNVLDLCYDIDYKTFFRTLVLEYLKGFKTYFETSYTGAFSESISPEEINLRRSVSFGRGVCIFCVAAHKETLDHSTMYDFCFKESFALFKKHGSGEGHPPQALWTAVTQTSENLAFVFNENVNNIVLKILEDKKDPVLKYRIPNSVIYKDLDTSILDKTLVTDSPESPCNSEKYFSSTTNLFLLHSQGLFEYEKVIELIGTIENENKKLEQDNPLFSGF